MPKIKQFLQRTNFSMLACTFFTVSLITACGGGGGISPSGSIAMLEIKSEEKAALAIGATVTPIQLQNLSNTTQHNVPITFGQVFAENDLLASESLTGRLSNGTPVNLQVDRKATHGNGSLRHAVISAIIPTLPAAGETLELVKTSGSSSTAAVLPHTLLDKGFTADTTITIGGEVYSASADAILAGGKVRNWLSGPIATEWLVSAPLRRNDGAAHPHLTARFAIRHYPNVNQTRVDAIVENNKTFAAAPQNFTYDVQININGQNAYSLSELTHLHHARWRKTLWDSGGEPAVHLKHDTAYLIASKAVPNYDQSLKPSETKLNALAAGLTAAKVGPMKIGLAVEYMPMAGGREDIGPLPNWAVVYLLSMDKRAKDAMLATADGSGSWSIHYRDENTGFPVRLDNSVNRNISTHPNMAHSGPLPVPRCATHAAGLCDTNYEHDGAHQPSLVYLPYLVTGDHYYLEELHFWSSYNPLGTSAGSHGYEKGLLRWDQIRGQAWTLRTLAHTAYATPDNDPMKTYYGARLKDNIDFYHATYPVANPNQLGVYDGSGAGSFMPNNGYTAAWQDDFLTWSFGHLVELGYTDAQPTFLWKTKYSIGRMTAPGYCWLEGAKSTRMRAGPGQPVLSTFAEVREASIPNDGSMYDDNGVIRYHAHGLSYKDQPCDSDAQTDWIKSTLHSWWARGRMFGYADSPIGYPANMQPALAVAATSGMPNAEQAWNQYMSRASKPNFNDVPVWAIIPRK